MKVDQNWVFEQFINHVTMNCSKTHFWSTFITSNLLKSEVLNSLKADEKWIFEQIKSRDHFFRSEIKALSYFYYTFCIEFHLIKMKKTMIRPRSREFGFTNEVNLS